MGSAERSGPSLSEGVSHVSGCLLTPHLHPLGAGSPFPLVLPSFHTNNCCWAKYSSHNTDNSVWFFCLPAAPVPASVGDHGEKGLGHMPSSSPGPHIGPAGTEQGFCVCLMNTRMDKRMGGMGVLWKAT